MNDIGTGIRFFLRGVVFVALAFAFLTALESLSKRYPPTDSQHRNLSRIQTVYEHADSIEVLVLGNSHASYSFDPDEFPWKAGILGLADNDIFEVETQARALAPSMPCLRQVILTVSYTSFHWDNALGEEERLLHSRRMFYAEGLLTPWISGDFRNYVQGKTYWLARSDHWRNVVIGLTRGIEWPTQNSPTQTHEDLREHAEIRVDRYLGRSRLMMAQDADLSQATYESLNRTIALLQDRGVDVVLVTPPYYTSYSERMEAAGKPAKMRALTRSLADENGVRWIDKSVGIFSSSPELFRDSDHLNARGREKFTRWLVDRHLDQGTVTSPCAASEAALSRDLTLDDTQRRARVGLRDTSG